MAPSLGSDFRVGRSWTGAESYQIFDRSPEQKAVVVVCVRNDDTCFVQSPAYSIPRGRFLSWSVVVLRQVKINMAATAQSESA
jgi:hypothetical protein